MFEIIRKICKTGVVTHRIPMEAAPQRFRGKLALQSQKCNNCEACVKICPAEAICVQKNAEEYELTVSYAKCIFCGLCAKACQSRAVSMTNNYHLSVKNKIDLVEGGQSSL